MLRMLKAIPMARACVSVALGAFALPVGAQRVAELTVGPVRQPFREQDSDSIRTPGISVANDGLIVDEARSGTGSAPFTGLPLRAPTRRCEDIGPLVTGFVLGTLAIGYGVSFLLPGGRRFESLVLPVVAIAAVGIGVMAAICNR